jgi:hypothetical protein
MKKWIISIAAFLFSFAAISVISFYAAIFLVGPHSSILPEIFFVPVALLLLALTLCIPALIFYKTFKRLKTK